MRGMSLAGPVFISLLIAVLAARGDFLVLGVVLCLALLGAWFKARER